MPSIFNTYAGKIEICNEIKQICLDFKVENELYDFYMNYYRGDIYINTIPL
jgi:hypothetical protein